MTGRKLCTYVLLTFGDEAFGGVGREPGLAVCGLIGFLDKLKLTRDLPVIEEAQSFGLVLHVFQIRKVKLREVERVHEAGEKKSTLCNITVSIRITALNQYTHSLVVVHLRSQINCAGLIREAL